MTLSCSCFWKPALDPLDESLDTGCTFKRVDATGARLWRRSGRSTLRGRATAGHYHGAGDSREGAPPGDSLLIRRGKS